MKNTFDIGIVSGVHGVKGELKIFPYTNDPENISRQKNFMINGKKMDVCSARINGRFIIIQLKGVETRTEAELFKNAILSLPRDSAAPLSEGEYYMEDIIGCDVFDDTGLLGKIDDIIETGSNDVYSVINGQGKEILIPALKSVVMKIDIESRRIDVRLPEGLMDDEYV